MSDRIDRIREWRDEVFCAGDVEAMTKHWHDVNVLLNKIDRLNEQARRARKLLADD